MPTPKKSGIEIIVVVHDLDTPKVLWYKGLNLEITVYNET